ncbi:MAG: AI-2E family transporter [Dongiaceae bacterium]
MTDIAKASGPVLEQPGSAALAPPVARPGGGWPPLLVVVVATAGLYFGREVFVPLALAVLLSFALAPATVLVRRGTGRVTSVIIVVALAFLVILGIGAFVAREAVSLAGKLPLYQWNIAHKIHVLQDAAPGSGVVGRASQMLKNLQEEFSKQSKPAATAAGGTTPGASEGTAQEQQPIPVQIRAPDPAPLQMLESFVGPLLGPLATMGIVIIFVVFILLQREDLRDRLIRLAGPRDLHRTTEAMNDAGSRVSRYLLMQLMINATFGVQIGIGLFLVGVPNAVLWALLAAMLRFVPYIGVWIAAAPALVLVLAVDPGWSMLLWCAALFVVVELITGNVVEPWLYGHSTGLTPIAVIVAAVVWAWLWGPVGLLLSTPLTVCLVVLGRHVPQLEFLNVLLGSGTVLAPEETFYQRLLAHDPEEASDQAEEYLRDKPLVQFYDSVAIPALGLAQADADRGALEPERRRRFAEDALVVMDNIVDDARPEDPAGTVLDPAALLRQGEVDEAALRAVRVLCVGGRSELDEAAAVMLAQLLWLRGLSAQVVPLDRLTRGRPDRDKYAAAELVCLSYVDGLAFTNARRACRSIRRRLPGIRVLAGFWQLTAEEAARRDPLAGTGADLAARSLAEAVEQVAGALTPPAAAVATAKAPVPAGPADAAPPPAAVVPTPTAA